MGLYKDRLVCFLDVLGFQQQIGATLNADGTENEAATSRIADAFESVRKTLDVGKKADVASKRVTQFSDSVVISYEVHEQSGVFWCLLELLWLQINLVSRSVLVRGGIARGPFVHTPKVLFGPALVTAYRLESAAAMYPRIVLDESILEIAGTYHAAHHDADAEKTEVLKLLARDGDGLYYIDYFGQAQSELNDPDCDFPSYLVGLRQLIIQGLKASDPSVVVKYRWMREKFNPVVSEAKSAYASDSDFDIAQAYAALELIP